MNKQLQISDFGFRIDWKRGGQSRSAIRNPQSAIRNRMAFTLVEVLVTMVLLSLIVLALMTVFNSTQNAFRASLTQTDVLESGRLAMGLITSDLEAMTPSYGASYGTNFSAVNFYSAVTNYASPVSPLLQSLTASSQLRTNVLESFFSLSRQNVNGQPSWVGTGYVVSTNAMDGTNIGALYPLYRFYTNMSVMDANPWLLYSNFIRIPPTNSPPWSHLMDGVVDLKVRAYNPTGQWMTNDVAVTNATSTNWVGLAYPSYPIVWGEPSVFYMYSNAVPASVEVELGVLEDTTRQRAEGLSDPAAQLNYLSNHVGQVHLFRQRVVVRNLDLTAYQ